MKMRYALLLLILIWLPGSVSADFYRYTGPDGGVRFTDNLNEVPEDQRPDVLTYEEAKKGQLPETQAPVVGEEQEGEPPPDAESPPDDTVTGEAAQSQEPQDRTVFDRLTRIKGELDTERAGLDDEKQKLAKEGGALTTPEEITAYNEKVVSLNKRIIEYEKRRQALQDEIDAYNAGIPK